MLSKAAILILITASSLSVIPTTYAQAEPIAQSSQPSSAYKDAPDTATSPSPVNILRQDSRLRKQIDAPERTYYIPALLRAFSDAAGIHILTKDIELQGMKVVALFPKTTVCDAMAALADLYLLRWEKQDDGSYLLKGTIPVTFMPQNDFARERFALGHQFLEDVSKLSPALQQQLLSGEDGASISDLPQGTQDKIKRMAETWNDEMQSLHGIKRPFDTDNMPDARVKFSATPKADYNSYFVALRTDKGMIGWTFNDLSERQTTHKAGSGSNNQSLYDARDFRDTDGSHPNAGNSASNSSLDEPSAKLTLNIDLPKATVPETAHAIASATGFAFITDDPKFMHDTVPVAIHSVSLVDACDTLLPATFKNTEWNLRPGKILIVRGPQNTTHASATRVSDTKAQAGSTP